MRLRYLIGGLFGGVLPFISKDVHYAIIILTAIVGGGFIAFLADYLPFKHVKVFNMKIKV